MGHGCRHQHGIAAVSPWTCAMSDAFQLSPRCVCSTALGTPVDPEVNKTRATSAGPAGESVAATGGPAEQHAPSASGSERASGARSSTRPGSTCPRAPATSAAPRSATAGPPRPRGASRPGPARQPPGCWGPARPRPPRAAHPGRATSGDCGHGRRVGLGGRDSGVPVDHLAAVGGEQRIERGHVPGPTRLAVAPGLARDPGGSQRQGHGRAP